MSRKILGLDIRPDAVSAVLINSSIKGTVIEAHGHVPLSGRNKDENGLSASLEIIAQKMDISDSICVASFPAEEISFRNIQVPFKGSKKIKKILPYELEPTLPFSVEDVIMDFIHIEIPDHANTKNIITAAVEKSKLQSFLDTLSTFNIEPEIVTVGGYPTAWSLANYLDSHKNWLFIDIDKNKSTIFIILSGRICLIRSFAIRADAHSYKLNSLCGNIRQTIYALEKIIGLDFELDGGFITGCGINDLDLGKDIEQALGFPIERLNILQITNILKQQSPPESWTPFLMDNALSLALMEVEGAKGFNFRKGPFALKKFWEENKKNLIQTGVFFILILSLGWFNVFLDSYFMEKRLARLDQQITGIFTSTFPEVKNIVDPVQQMKIKIQQAKENALLPGETEKHIRAIDILNTISKATPKDVDVTLKTFVMGAESVSISGDTDSFNSVDNIKSKLEQADIFKKIVISSANIDKFDKRVRFKLKLNLQ
jgi:type II secretory pathway component PulL